MKKKLFILIVLSFLIACNGEDVYVPELKLSTNSCVLSNDNQYILVQVLNDENGKYQIKMSQEGVVKIARLWDSSQFYIIALKKGDVEVTVTDENDISSRVLVSVSDEIKNIEITSDIVYIKVNDEKEIYYPQYISLGMTSLSDSHIIGYKSISEKNKVWIRGEVLGETQLSIYDPLYLRHIFDIQVVDVYDLILSRGDTNLDIYNKDYYFHIYSGNGGYQVESSDLELGSCQLLEYRGDETLAVLSNPATIKVTPHKGGVKFVITITDSEGKEKRVNLSTGFLMGN